MRRADQVLPEAQSRRSDLVVSRLSAGRSDAATDASSPPALPLVASADAVPDGGNRRASTKRPPHSRPRTPSSWLRELRRAPGDAPRPGKPGRVEEPGHDQTTKTGGRSEQERRRTRAD